MPRGGFGNLIALPLQHDPRQQGNSVFLDDQLEADPDDQQWAYLASMPAHRSRGAVDRIASRRDAAGSGCRRAHRGDGRRRGRRALDAARPPGTRRRSSSPEPLPSRCAPSSRRGSSSRRQAFRRRCSTRSSGSRPSRTRSSTRSRACACRRRSTPRVIACAEDLPQHVGLPRGCQLELETLLREYGVALEVADERVCGEPLALPFRGKLTADAGQAGRDRASRERHRRIRRAARGRQDSRRHIPRRGTRLQHAGPGPPPAAPRPVACATPAVPGYRSEGDRPDRSGQEEPATVGSTSR